MKKSLKILFALPAFVLCACDNNKALDETNAKSQLAAMKEEVAKDSFIAPSKGSMTTEAVTTLDSTTITITGEIRFDTTVGNRYLYTKANALGMDAETWYYEKDGEYFNVTSAMGVTDTTTYATEAEFTTAFNEIATSSKIAEDSMKEFVTNTYDEIESLYTESSENAYEYTLNFTKINDSSFKLVINGTAKNSSVDFTSIEETIEFENYLPTKATVNNIGPNSSATLNTIYTWNSVEYIYPSK